jgi:4-amino-4-deoxy-L-arabinose transferase-like glycosyltransferase
VASVLPRVSTKVLALGGLTLAALVIRLPGLGIPLLEWHGWRQTWTAYTALLFHEQGIDLLHPKLPIFGPPFEVPMEFPLVQALAALVMDAGVTPDLAMRLTHLGLFFLSAGLLYGLLRHTADEQVAAAGLVFFLFVPANILISRTSLVEFGAIAGAIGYLWAGIAWRERPRWWTWSLALLAGSLGMLVKPTTPLFWVLPLVLWSVRGESTVLRSWLRSRLTPGLAVLCIAPTAIATAWMAWADAIKGAQEAAAWTTSTASRPFYYSSLTERLDPSIWFRNWEWLSLYVIGLGVLPVFLIGVRSLRQSGRALFWWGILLATVLPVLVFFGGYWRHDYYWVALTPGIAAIVGLGVTALLKRARSSLQRALVFVSLAAAAVVSLVSSNNYWGLSYPPLADPVGVLSRARELAAQSQPDDLVLVVGRASNPDLAYYSRRSVLMLTRENQTDHLMRGLAAQPSYHVLFSWNPQIDPIWVANYWAWTGVVSARTYTLGASPRDLRGAPIVASDDLAAFDAAADAGRPLLEGPLRIQCDGLSHPVPAGASGTWLRLRAEPGALVTVAVLFAPVPARGVIVLSPLVTHGLGSASLSCEGASEIVIDGALDTAPPG